MPKRKNHYENLGVSKDATANDIKRAYRAKARKTHPDKGGNAEEFAEVSNAYEVLSDPARKQLYDATGMDDRPPIDEEVHGVLLQLFSQYVLDDTPDILAAIREHLREANLSFTLERRRLGERRQKLEKRRNKITSTAEVNLAHLVIDNELVRIDQAIANFDHKLEVGKAIKAALAAYSEEQELRLPAGGFHTYTVSFDWGGSQK